jgi:predicted ArsR family transcriptional regulator
MEAPTPLADGLLSTLAFVRGEPEPPSAADVASALAVPRSVARWRLERLVERGLLLPGYARRTGRAGPGAGRPTKTYAIAPGAADLEQTTRAYADLVRLLVATLPARGRRARLAEVGRRFGEGLAGAAGLRPARRAETAGPRIARALGRLGFQTSAEISPAGIAFETPTCPLRPLVANDRAAIELDRGMWQSLVGAGLDNGATAVRCETHDCLSTDRPCRIVVELSGSGKTATRPIAYSET